MLANDTSKPAYDRDYDHRTYLTPDQAQAELADLEQRYATTTLTLHEEQQFVALLAKVRGVYLSVTGLKNTYPAYKAYTPQPFYESNDMRQSISYLALAALLLGGGLLGACGNGTTHISTPSSTLGTDSSATKVGGSPAGANPAGSTGSSAGTGSTTGGTGGTGQ